MEKKESNRSALIIGLFLSLTVSAASILDDYLHFPHPVIKIITMLLGSGMGFILIAFAVGWFSNSYKKAIGISTICVLLALSLYYLAIPMLNLRPGAGVQDILKVGLMWAAVGIGCSFVVGSLAYFAHKGTISQRSLASGYTLGLILGTVVGYFITGGDLSNSEINLVLLFTSLIVVIGYVASLKRTKWILLTASLVLGVLSTIVLFALIYKNYY